MQQQLHDFWSQRVELEKSASSRFNNAYQTYYGSEPQDFLTSYEPGQYISPQRRFANPYMVNSSYINPSNPNSMRDLGPSLKHDPLYGVPLQYHYTSSTQNTNSSSRLRIQTSNESRGSRQKRQFYEHLNTGYAFGGRSHIKFSQHPKELFATSQTPNNSQQTKEKSSIFGKIQKKQQQRPKSSYSGKTSEQFITSTQNTDKQKDGKIILDGQKIANTDDVLNMIETTRSNKIDQKLFIPKPKLKQMSSRRSLKSLSINKTSPKLMRPQSGGGKRRINPDKYRTHLQEFMLPTEEKRKQHTVEFEPITVDKMLDIKKQSQKSSRTSKSRVTSITDQIKKVLEEKNKFQNQEEEVQDQEIQLQEDEEEKLNEEQDDETKSQEEKQTDINEDIQDQNIQCDTKSLASENSKLTGRTSSYASSSAMKNLYQILQQERQKREQLEKVLLNYIKNKDK